MVVQGGFSLQLIDAETQQPLNEYRGPSGSVYYAEGQPGKEYFLRFQVLKDDIKKKAGDSGAAAIHDTMMYFRPAVDGKDLGFYTNLTKSHGARDVGLWTYVNGIGTNQALKFETAAVDADNNKDKTATTSSILTGAAAAVSEQGGSAAATATKTSLPPRLYMGNVQVRISKAVFTGQQKRVYTSVPALTQQETVMEEAAASISANSSLHEEEDEANANTSVNNNKTEGAMTDPVPILRTREGAAKFQQKFTEECPTYQPGELLETITIHYGSTAALVQAGILVPYSGVVPQYVGVPPPPPTAAAPPRPVAVVAPPVSNTAPTKAPSPRNGKVVSPLLNAPSVSPTGGVKRVHSATTTAESGKGTDIQPPATKKQCVTPPNSTQEPAVAPAVVSK